MNHHAKFRADRSKRCRDMTVYPFVKTAAVRHVGFLKVRNYNSRTLQGANMSHSAKFRADCSSRCRDIWPFLVFQMAAVRHLGVLKVGNLTAATVWRASVRHHSIFRAVTSQPNVQSSGTVQPQPFGSTRL